MTIPNSQRTLMRLKLMLTQVRTFLMHWFQVAYLAVYLGIRLLLLLESLVLESTFFSLAVVKNFLDSNPDGYCLYFDTEAAVNKSLLESRGLDLSRLVVVNVVTVEEFRSKALKAVDMYMKAPEGDRKPCMFVLDSLGMLSTEKEITDALNDKQVRT